jgi:hypothetical protein
MPHIIKEITLEVSKPNLFQALAAKQGDYNSRYLKVTFTDDGNTLPIATHATVKINALRSNDGKSSSFAGVVNEDNTVTVPLHEWILALDGIVQCDISVTSGDKKLTSTSFLVNVEKAANAEGLYYDELADMRRHEQEIYAGTDNTFASPYITSVRDYCFYKSALETIDLPEVTNIGNYAFQNSTKLKNVKIPLCESIGIQAFRECASLESINLPCIKTISEHAFTGCTALAKLILPGATIPVLTGTLASTNNFGAGGIYVHVDLVEAYKTATNWSTLKAYIKPISELEVAE